MSLERPLASSASCGTRSSWLPPMPMTVPMAMSMLMPVSRRWPASLAAQALVALTGAALATGCADPAQTPAPPAASQDMAQPSPDQGPQADMAQPVEPDMAQPIVRRPAQLTSARPRVNFKGGRRLATDLSRALELPRDQLCLELSTYDCVEQVHRITLGGVEPYSLGINEPVPISPVTAPIAVDRLALQACDRRAQLDLEPGAQALIFAELARVAPGADPTRAQLDTATDALYERLVQRDPSDLERRALADLWTEARAKSPSPARDWATLSCFMVATSLEALFY